MGDPRTETQNDAGTCADSDTRLTQASSGPVHPYASEISRLDAEMRAASGDTRERKKADLAHAKAGPDRPNGKRFIGRQMAVDAGTYKPPQPRWLAAARAEA